MRGITTPVDNHERSAREYYVTDLSQRHVARGALSVVEESAGNLSDRGEGGDTGSESAVVSESIRTISTLTSRNRE